MAPMGLWPPLGSCRRPAPSAGLMDIVFGPGGAGLRRGALRMTSDTRIGAVHGPIPRFFGGKGALHAVRPRLHGTCLRVRRVRSIPHTCAGVHSAYELHTGKPLFMSIHVRLTPSGPLVCVSTHGGRVLPDPTCRILSDLCT